MDAAIPGAEIRVEGGVASCLGAWTVDGLSGLDRRLERFPWPDVPELVLDGTAVGAMDTAGAWVLDGVARSLARSGRRLSLRLRPQDEALLDMVRKSAASGLPPGPPRSGLLSRLGSATVATGGRALGVLAFMGETAMAAAGGLARPRRIRWRQVLHDLQEAGFSALPIIGLLSFLMGLVIAYQGSLQLRRYGASIFVADLVGFAMLRELSPLLTAIIVAGRSGSAYAAQIGTMKVTEEVDALRTVGIPPLELLVLPKVAALVVALPLLTVYADVLGVAGGMVVASSELGVGAQDFLDRFVRAMRISDYLVGVGKAPVFAAIVAVTGCYQGFQVGGDAESVGRRTTVSVVQSVFAVIVVDAVFSVIFSRLGL
ncbi:MAG TPA: ABC transporter permease [Anaeromyxobacteraceae bacterium]|nr:ABC transporter permease [Anaeromyxobacteraceae bacterium]